MNKYALSSQSALPAKKTAQTITLEKSFTHALILGQTGCGKTSSAILPLMLERMGLGHGILAFDYKGVEHSKIKAIAKRAGRLKDVVMINVPWGERINLLDGASTDVLAQFLQDSFGSSSNDFWANMATSVSLYTLELLKALEAVKNADVISGINLERYQYSLSALFKCVGGFDEVVEFYKDMRSLLQKISERFLHFHISRDKLQDLQNYWHCIKELRRTATTFTQYLKSQVQEIQSSSDKDRALYRNYVFMLGAIANIAKSTTLNEGKSNISSLLRQKKIVIVNLQDIDNSTMALLFGGVLNSLIRQNQQENLAPVSVFIDEANRVINPKLDLGADVFREAKVELIIAAQNQEMLMNNLGTNGYRELMGNLSSQYFFTNPQPQFAGGKDMDFSHLKRFECYFGGKVYLFEPIFLEQKELFEAELGYQKQVGVNGLCAAGGLSADEIVIYNPKVLQDSGWLLAKSRAGAYRQVPFLSGDDIASIERLKNNKIARGGSCEPFARKSKVNLEDC